MTEYRQIEISVGSTIIGRAGILSVNPLNFGVATVAKKAAKPIAVPVRTASPAAASIYVEAAVDVDDCEPATFPLQSPSS